MHTQPGANGDHIIVEQLELVRKIAHGMHQHMPRHVPLEDIVQAGVIGLVSAARNYDPARALSFRSYASVRIRGAILDNLRAMDWSPRKLRREERKIEKAYRLLRCKFARDPTEDELAEETGMALKDLQRLLMDIHGLRLLAPTGQSGSAMDLSTNLAKQAFNSPLRDYWHSEIRALLANALKDLPEKEGRVLKLYYFGECSMKDIGVTMDIGESRVSQIHARALAHLRTRLCASVAPLS